MKTKIILIICLCSMQVLNAQIRPADVDKIVKEEMVRQNLPGLAVGVYRRGVINYVKGYGYQDLDNRKTITTSTIFRWASISKTVTAVAALQLAEKRSDFSISDKVTKHYSHWIANMDGKAIPDKSRKSSITIKQLLAHRSGINHYSRGTAGRAGQYKNEDKSNYRSDSDGFNANSCVDIFRKANLDFTPGSKFLYTTYGFNLLGAVIDKKSGSYTNWVKNNIKNKLGMSSLRVATGTFYGIQKPKDGILVYGRDGKKEWVLPGGGWESNIGDLLKFARGLAEERLLRNTSALWASDGYKDSNGRIQEYKRGVRSTGSGSSLRIWHGGAHDHLRTLMYVMPERDIAVVVMIPAEYASTFNIVRRIINKMGIPRDFSTKPAALCGDGMGSSGRKFTGLYLRNGTGDVVIRRGYNTGRFNKEWNFLTSQGYHLEDFETYIYKGQRVWDGLFVKGTGRYAMWRNYDQNGFYNKWNEMKSKGYRLYDLETYKDGSKRYWAGLFKKEPGKQVLWRNFSTGDFAKKRDQMTKSGYKLIDIEVYSDSRGNLKWSGVWIGGREGLLNRNYDYSDFKQLARTRARQGYKLIDVETYMYKGKRKWAGIWERNSGTQPEMVPSTYCIFMKRHNTYSNQGYPLIDLESY